MRFFVGFGVGGLYCVDLPLVQEFMPTSKRGWVGGLVTCSHPDRRRPRRRAGRLHGRRPSGGCLFAIGVLPSLLVAAGAHLGAGIATLAGRRQGRYEEARKSLAWALAGRRRDPADADGADRRSGGQDQLARALQVSAQPAGLVARQCRARKPASTASRCGRRRCSCCC